MVDHEVESTLREIRVRVIAESAQTRAVALPSSSTAQDSASGGGASDAARDGVGSDALARLQANIATTERAWSRLPPVLSYRRGLAARVELWLKRQIKRAAHWFTWEQVNFNSATHHALTDARDALAAHEQALSVLRAALRHQQAEAESNAARISELQASFDGAFAQFASSVEQLRAEQHALDVEHRAQIQSRAAELRNEMRERVEHLLEEQRVCFKQLSLEAAEAAVMHDRARRRIETRIEALETKIVTSDK